MTKPTSEVLRTLGKFTRWLDEYGFSSYDHQSYYAGPIGRRAKAFYYRHPLLGILAVLPMVASEAVAPHARRAFHRRIRFPIADAHYAMGFLFLGEATSHEPYRQRVEMLFEHLCASRCPGYQEYCWGYPFNWVTRSGTITAGTPLITTTPYVYEAFLQLYGASRDERWQGVLDSIVRHVLTDIRDTRTSATASACSYTPFDTGGVINASAYRAFLLTSASVQLGCGQATTPAERNLRFVLESQQPDGSWYYANDGQRTFVDHFHTCFVLKALAKIHALRPDGACEDAINKGLDYYMAHLIDTEGLPKPFARAPRLTLYRKELYDYAESLNLCLLLQDRRPELKHVLEAVLNDLFASWIKQDGSFRGRRLLVGWDNVPMHRWGQSQMFRSLALYFTHCSDAQLASDGRALSYRSTAK